MVHLPATLRYFEDGKSSTLAGNDTVIPGFLGMNIHWPIFFQLFQGQNPGTFQGRQDITTVAGPEEGFYNLDGSLQESKVKALSRTYAAWQMRPVDGFWGW